MKTILWIMMSLLPTATFAGESCTERLLAIARAEPVIESSFLVLYDHEQDLPERRAMERFMAQGISGMMLGKDYLLDRVEEGVYDFAIRLPPDDITEAARTIFTWNMDALKRYPTRADAAAEAARLRAEPIPLRFQLLKMGFDRTARKLKVKVSVAKPIARAELIERSSYATLPRKVEADIGIMTLPSAEPFADGPQTFDLELSLEEILAQGPAELTVARDLKVKVE